MTPNIIIGTSLGYTFMDFMINTDLIAWVGMLVSVLFFYLVFRKPLPASQQGDPAVPAATYPEPKKAIANTFLFTLHTGIFSLIVVLLITHAQTGISVAFIGVIAAALTLLAANKDAWQIIKKLTGAPCSFLSAFSSVWAGWRKRGC